METNAKITIKKTISQYPFDAAALKGNKPGAIENFAQMAGLKADFIRLHLPTIKRWID